MGQEVDVVPVPENQGGYRIPKSLLDAISDIQQYSVMESEGATDIPPGYATPKRKIAYFNIGFIYGVGDSILLFIMSPFLYASISGILPVFGKEVMSLFDKFYVFLLSKYLSIGLFFLMCYALSLAKGNVSRSLSYSLIAGYVSATILRVIVFLFGYRIFYFHIPEIQQWLYNMAYTFYMESQTSPMKGFLPKVWFWLGFVFERLIYLLETIKPVVIKTSDYETVFGMLILILTGAIWFYFEKIRGTLMRNPFYGRFGNI